MDNLAELQNKLDHWKEKYEKAKSQKIKKNIEKREACEKMEEADKQCDLLKQELKEKENQVAEERAAFQEELRKLQKKNNDMTTVILDFQQRLERSKENLHNAQGAFQVNDQLPSTNINFVKEVSDDPSRDESSDIIGYTCHITAGRPYVLEANQALLTFVDEEVASSIIRKGKHTVDMDGKEVNGVRASEPELERSIKFEVKMGISNKKMKISNLPPFPSEETLKDKVELSFYKSAMGGGEIEAVDYDPKLKCAYVTYLQSGVAQRVLKKQKHTITTDCKEFSVKVDPIVDVQLDKVQMFSGISKRSVLLKGIKDIDEDEDTTQDLLQIHFQKTSLGGGEVEAIAFSEEGNKFLMFQEDLTEA